jgi:tartrate-resistant acid phosphatase type 5
LQHLFIYKIIEAMKKFFFLGMLLQLSIVAMAQTDNSKVQEASGHPTGVIDNLQTIKKSLNFLVMGDWGRHGEQHQRNVAQQMSNATVGLKATFNLIVGDNFYPNGVMSVFDPSWQSSFENVYTQHPLYDDWYVVLGNHDYRTNPDAEVAYSKISARWIMPARNYSIIKKLDDGGTAEFFFIDTSPFQTDYYGSEEYGANVKGVDTAAQKKWLEDGLKNSTATWKFVIGHHPLYSAGGRKGKTGDMLNSFGPLFEKYKVDAYFCGHEHVLEFDQPAEYHFVEIISGAGSEATPVTSAPYAKFAMQDFGFVAASLTSKELLIQYINEEGKILYTTTLSK